MHVLTLNEKSNEIHELNSINGLSHVLNINGIYFYEARLFRHFCYLSLSYSSYSIPSILTSVLDQPSYKWKRFHCLRSRYSSLSSFAFHTYVFSHLKIVITFCCWMVRFSLLYLLYHNDARITFILLFGGRTKESDIRTQRKATKKKDRIFVLAFILALHKINFFRLIDSNGNGGQCDRMRNRSRTPVISSLHSFGLFFFINDEMNKDDAERPEIKSIDIILTLHCVVLIGNLFTLHPSFHFRTRSK